MSFLTAVRRKHSRIVILRSLWQQFVGLSLQQGSTSSALQIKETEFFLEVFLRELVASVDVSKSFGDAEGCWLFAFLVAAQGHIEYL